MHTYATHPEPNGTASGNACDKQTLMTRHRILGAISSQEISPDKTKIPADPPSEVQLTIAEFELGSHACEPRRRQRLVPVMLALLLPVYGDLDVFRMGWLYVTRIGPSRRCSPLALARNGYAGKSSRRKAPTKT